MFNERGALAADDIPALDDCNTGRIRVLIVDDDPAFRSLLGEVSRSLGYETVEAENGRQAMRLLSGLQPQLIVLDIFMPDQDGIETLQQLRNRSPRPRVIAMSGAYSGRFLTMAKALGADATLLKPFSIDDFVAVLQDVCSKR